MHLHVFGPILTACLAVEWYWVRHETDNFFLRVRHIMMICWFWTVMIWTIFFRSFQPSGLRSGSMEHSSLLKVKYFFKCPSFQWGLFTCSDHVWLIHSIRSIYKAWSAIWIICSVFCYDIFAHFSSFFIWIQRQSILLPAEWPCIFLVHLSYVYIFSPSFASSICSSVNVRVFHCQLWVN